MSTTLKHLILICGDEEYLKEQKKKELLGSLTTPGSFNFNTFSSDTADPAELGRLIQTLPFLEEHRTILLEDTGWLKGAVSEEILTALSEIPESCYCIFFEKDTDAGNRLYKLIQKQGEVCRFTSAESKKGRDAMQAKTDIRNWIRDTLEKENRRIDAAALNELTELAGYDMLNLKTELEKLISYTYNRGPGSRITREDIDQIASKTLNDRVFEMASARLQGRTGRAIAMLEELYALKTPPMRILFILVRQFQQAYALKECQEERLSDAQIMSRMDIRDWLLRKLKDQTARISKQELKRLLELAVSYETAVKNGDMGDRLAVEILLAG